MSDTPPLPELHQSEIDENTLSQLITDIGEHTQVIEVIPKFGPGYVGQAPTIQLDEAFQFLTKRKVRGVQFHYRHQAAHWCDTVMPLPDGRFRIVRMDQSQPAG
ncbi:hypothetical protein [Haloferula rosea]|uniref:Uncharacterized protein n=1 Tax=Haloferula rosea TaxID=490093 RepID=A0A934RET9_9BACT|nr:hypothetical protein [Haloferula rosea]MBK1827100.1 hypothetical protein [Haloferula rosea]